MQQLKKGLSVFVPALNEERHLESMTVLLVAALRESVEHFELLMVDDGSTDGTGRIMDSLAQVYPEIRVFHNDRPHGLGLGYKKALFSARFNTITDIPGDDSYDIESMKPFWSATRSGNVIIGCRMNQWQMRTRKRALLSTLFTWTVNILFGLSIRDVHGVVAVPVAFVRQLPLDFVGYTYQMEILAHLLVRNTPYSQEQVLLKPDDAGKSSALKAQTFFDVSRTLLRLFWTLRLFPAVK